MKLRITRTYTSHTYPLFTLIFTLFFSYPAFSQTAITNFTSSSVLVSGGTSNQVIAAHPLSVNNITPNANYTVSYNNTNNVKITGFSIAGASYFQHSGFDTIIFRRVASNGIPANGNKQQIYCAGPVVAAGANTIPLTVAYPQVANFSYMEETMKDGYINRGCDNVFTNTGDLTFNNIERVDIVKLLGYATSAPANAGFFIAERGGNDGFKIAAITGVDAFGNPTSFGSVLSVAAAAFNAGANLWTGTTVVMRKDHNDNVLRPFSQVASQTVKALYVSFSDLNIVVGQRIYGYSLMAPDVTAKTSAEILNYSNSSVFPTNTDASIGGLDLASSPGMFTSGGILPVSLLSFAAGLNNRVVNISWETTDEATLRNFEVERSYDGADFSSIGTVLPNTIHATYNYTDETPGLNEPNIYYRLKMIDKNGTPAYSGMKLIKNNITEAKVTVYPNPVSDRLFIEVPNGWLGAELNIRLYNMNGTPVQSVHKTNAAAIETVNISGLVTGTYTLSIISAKGSFSKKIMKD